MTIIMIFIMTIFMIGCDTKEMKKVLEDEKLKNDSSAVMEDVIELGEELLRDELNLPGDKK